MRKVKAKDFSRWTWSEWPAVSNSQRFGQAFYNRFAVLNRWEFMPKLFYMTDTKEAQWFIIENLLEE